MKGINKVILVGTLGRDPEVRYMQNGGAVTTLSLATSESWKDDSGQKQERTEWHRVVMFRKLAEIAGEYLQKGSKVYIEGKLRTRKYTGQDGNERSTTEINADEMQMLDGPRDGGSREAPRQDDRGRDSRPQQRTQSRPPADDYDDDIPF